MSTMQFSKSEMDQIGRIAARVSGLKDRCDAYERRERARQERKPAKRSRCDGDDPSNPTAPPDFREDNYLPAERNELRTGALSKADSFDALQRLHNIRGQLPKRMSDTHLDRAEFSEVQARYDSVFQALGKHGKGPGYAVAPKENEGLMAYRYALADSLKRYSPKYRDIGLRGVGISAFRVLEPQIIADALQESHHPTEFAPGELREMVRFDESGRRYLE